MISVLVLTFNEEKNIEACLESLPTHMRMDIHILDSYSTDSTVSIAERKGVTIHRRKFTNYAEQRNFGLAQDFKFDWILMIDADERLSAELAIEIQQRIAFVSEATEMFRCRRRDMFMGKWLKRSSGYPTYFPRLFRKGCVRVEREINEEYFCHGVVESLNEHLIHYPFEKGLQWWFERHARYAAMEATKLSDERQNRELSFVNLFSSDPNKRRAEHKQIAYRLPFRPLLVFTYLYFLRGGFLDGHAGFTYAQMRRTYESMIDSVVAGVSRGERP